MEKRINILAICKDMSVNSSGVNLNSLAASVEKWQQLGIPVFCPYGKWKDFIEQLEFYIEINSKTEERKKKLV